MKVAIAVLCLLSSAAQADAWLDPGDSVLRHDLQYLIDSKVISMPITAWPIPSADLARVLDSLTDREALSPGQLATLRRVERHLSVLKGSATRRSVHVAGAFEPILLRGFEDTPREEGEIGARFSAATDRFSGRLAVTTVADPEDGKRVRLDDSYVTMRLGNWLFTAGALTRWWGPGWEGALLLSTSARPVPALSIDRESSQEFSSRWLGWLGPWRATAFMGMMEEERQDLDHPLLFGARVTFRPLEKLRIWKARPFQGLELGLERTAQWCAETLPCNPRIFWNLLRGDDNAGETVDPEEEPGNQLAGWTIRWTPPIRVPLSIYRQKSGETIDIGTLQIRKSLELWGAETWGETPSGLTWRLHGEFAGTACGELAGRGFPLYSCAYINHLFPIEGYRYRGRPLGHSADGDARTWTLGLLISASAERSGSILLRRADLNRNSDPRYVVAPVATELWNLELGYRERLAGGLLMVGVGLDRSKEVSGERDADTARAFASFTHDF